MATLRQAHKHRYTCITNALAQDNSLSLRARGLMLYLLSLPDDWQIHLNHLCKIMKEGEYAIESTLKAYSVKTLNEKAPIFQQGLNI